MAIKRMYKVFEAIPVKVRQEAFELIADGIGERARWHGESIRQAIRESVWVSLYNEEAGGYSTYCPLGVVNHVLGLDSKGGVITRSPGCGETERDILKQAGISINKRHADSFIGAVDNTRFVSLDELATAMGAEYNGLHN